LNLKAAYGWVDICASRGADAGFGGDPNHFVIITENRGNAYHFGWADSVQSGESFGFARKATLEFGFSVSGRPQKWSGAGVHWGWWISA